MMGSLWRWCLLCLGLVAALVAGNAYADDNDHGNPSVPIADLSLTMTRTGELQVGGNTSYSLVVRNAGPNVASGPIGIVDTLPNGMTLVSAGGPGWTCFANAPYVICANAGPLAVGAALPPLTLTVNSTAAGTYTNTATVGSITPENVWANNTASDTAAALAVGATAYVFTAAECKTGQQVGNASGDCPKFVGPAIAGSTANLYLTTMTVNAKGQWVVSPWNLIGATTSLVQFSMACDTPVQSKVVAAYSLVPAGLKCSAPKALDWSKQLTLTFPKDKVSLLASFAWEDVGKVTLKAIDSKGKTASTEFVVKPDRLEFKYVLRSGDGAPLPANRSATGFVKAGEAFTLVVGAKTSSNPQPDGSNWAPSFGLEPGSALASPVNLVLDDGAAPPNATVPSDFTGADGSGFTSTGDGFVAGTKLAWYGLGVLNLKPVLNDYLGAGAVDGVGQVIGRFYPDHFETTTEGVFKCLKNMACPASVNGAAVYSGQKFPVTVTVFGVNNRALNDFAGTITLEAYDRPGGDGKDPGGILVGQPLQLGEVTAEVGKKIQANLSYHLAFPFDSSDPRALKWTKPTPIYVRASIKLHVVKDNKGNIEKDHPVTSKDGAVDDPNDAPVEGGIMVVHGRLQLANAFGSELLKLPVRVNAQYWNGTLWDNNSADSTSTIGAEILFTDCQKALLKDGKCDLGLVKTDAPPGPLKDGAGTILLAAPGRGNTGSTWLQVVDPANLSWLPSTRARAVWGIYKSPLIYIRELY